MSCERCGDTGFVITPDGGNGTASRCPCKVPSMRQRLETAGVWPKYLECTRASWKGPWPESRLVNWPAPACTCTLHGLVGRGKTHLATAIFAETLATVGWGMWRDVSDALEALKRGISTGQHEVLLDRMKRTPLLLLDDLGAHHATEWTESLLSSVLRSRHGRQLPTILTLNIGEDPQRPGHSLGLLAIDDVEPRLASRLSEGVVIELRGQDWRKAATRPALAPVPVAPARVPASAQVAR